MKSQEKSPNGRINADAARASCTVVASKSLLRRYKALLQGDWTKGALGKILALLWDEISHGISGFTWQEVLNPNRPGITERDICLPIVERIEILSSLVPNWLVPSVHVAEWTARNGRRSLHLLAQAETTWTYLMIQRLAEVKGETGLLLDTQSLLFLVALDDLLPILKDRRMHREHGCLLNAMSLFTLNFLTDQPSHYHYLASLLMQYLGEKSQEQRHLYRAFRLTSPKDHSYLTKAQAYSDALLNEGKKNRALEFLNEVCREAQPSNYKEIREMILALKPAEARSRARLKRIST